MNQVSTKKNVSPGDLKKNTCCAPAPPGTKGGSPCCPAPPSGDLPEASAIAIKVSSDWSLSDRIGRVRCRLGSLRNDYRVSPGLYAVGSPDKGSPVFVSANYKL